MEFRGHARSRLAASRATPVTLLLTTQHGAQSCNGREQDNLPRKFRRGPVMYMGVGYAFLVTGRPFWGNDAAVWRYRSLAGVIV